MDTLLFIKDSFCTSLEQLRQYFCMDLQSDKQLYEELLTLQRDKVISNWLAEGSNEEKMLSKKLDNIPCEISNSELMKELISIFSCNKEMYVLFPSISSYFEIISYSVYSKTSNNNFRINDNIIFSIKEIEECYIILKFKVKKIDNETFTIKAICNQDECVTKLSVPSFKIGEIVTINLPFPNVNLGVQKINVISNSELLFSFTINLVKDIQKYLDFDECSSIRFGNAILGVSSLNDFNCSNNAPVYYLGATLNFKDGLLAHISIPNHSEAFYLFTQLFDNKFYDSISFKETYSILKKYNFTFGKNSFSENIFAKSMSSTLKPSLLSASPVFALMNIGRQGAASIIKSQPGYAIYDDELIKETKDFVCIFNFHSNKCTGFHNLDIARTLPNTLQKIIIRMK